MKRLLISAAEPSGDQLGADLIRDLGKRCQVEAYGLAGPKMRAAGVEPIARMEDVCAMGLFEVFGRLPAILKARRALKKSLHRQPDAVVLIDAPDLHLPLGAAARKQGLKTIGWVSPQIWAWRPDRASTIGQSYEHLMCLFDFEPPLYPNIDARWTGHPVIDRLVRRTQVDPRLIGLTPGSRKQETDRMWPVFLSVAHQIREEHPHHRFRLVSPVPHLDVPSWIERGDTIEDLASASAVLTKSGTVTLELAVMGVPQVVAHRVHPMTHWLGQRLVHGIRHIAMPNILSGTEVIPEFVQDLKPAVLAATLMGLPDHQAIDLSALGEAGVVDRTADQVGQWLGLA
jgi:lipid-A-disaccharide synthase